MDEQEIAAAIAHANASGEAMEIVSGSRMRAIGRRIDTSAILSLYNWRGIEDYDPNTMLITAKAGTPVGEVERELASCGQQLAFEPMDYGLLLGKRLGSSVGSVFAANLIGPRGITSGTLHDNITGIRAINGSGHIVEYTGAQCGCLINSWGTLGIISNVKIKAIPVAKACKTMFLTGLNDAVGTNFLAEAASASSLVSGAAHLQKAFAARLASGQLANAGGSITAIRIEGELTAIRNCTAKINQVFAYFGEMHDMDENVASQFWKEMQRLGFLTNAKGAIWKLDIMPSRSAKCVSDLSNILPLHAGYDRSGMVVWLEVPGTADANAADIRRTVARYGGSAMLVYANGKTMDEVEPFQPMTELQMAITRKIKQHFDPAGILNPGRMYDGV